MTVPVEWEPDDGSVISRMMNLVRTDDMSFLQVMAELMARSWVYPQADGFGITDKGAAKLSEVIQREEDELLEQAQNFGVMTIEEQAALMSKACSFYFPNAPESEEMTQDEIDEIFVDVLQRLGVARVSIH